MSDGAGAIGAESPDFRADRWLTAALAVVGAALAAPILLADYVPYLDLPQHVGAVAILAGGPESWRLHDYYDIDLLGSPYLLPYLVAAGLAQLLGAEGAVKVMFAVAAAALPWSVSWAAARLDRDPRIGLVAAPLAYGTFAFMGFLNFVLSLPLWLLWLGWWRQAVDRPAWSWRQWLAGGALSVALFYGHVMTLAFSAGCCFVVAVLAAGPKVGERWQVRALVQRLGRALHFLPGLLLFVLWAGLSNVSKQGELGRMLGASQANTPPKWAEPLDALKALLDYTLSVYHDGADEKLLLAAVGVFGVLWLARRSERSRGGLVAEDAIVPVLWLSALGLSVALPESYRGIWPIGARMAPFVCLLALLLPRGRIVLPRVAVALGLALGLTTAWTHQQHFARFQEEVGELDEAIAPIADGRRTMTLVFDKHSQVVKWPAFLHFSQYVVARKGGVAEFSFVNFTKSPIHYAELNAPPRNPVRFEWTPERFELSAQRDYWDFLLIRGSSARAQRVFAGQPAWEGVYRGRRWALLRRPGG